MYIPCLYHAIFLWIVYCWKVRNKNNIINNNNNSNYYNCHYDDDDNDEIRMS